MGCWEIVVEGNLSDSGEWANLRDLTLDDGEAASYYLCSTMKRWGWRMLGSVVIVGSGRQ